MIDSRNLADLHPLLQVLANELIKRMSEKGYNVLVTSTYRDYEKQNALYAQGRTTAGSIVTNAKAGMSAHNHRLAFDICKNMKSQEYSDLAFFNMAGEIGRELGLEWGGDFTSIKDKPHFQMMLGHTCNQYLVGTKVPETVKAGCGDKRLVKSIQQLLGVDADGLFGAKTKEAVYPYHASGEVDAATLQKLIEMKTLTKVQVNINGKLVEVHGQLVNNSWKLPAGEIVRLLPDEKLGVRAILESAGYVVGWENGVITAKRV